MKKFQINSKNLATPLLALSLMAGCVGLFGGSASAASVTVSESVNSSWPAYYTNSPECDSLFPGAVVCDETAAYFPSISSAWPISYDNLSSGGNSWHFGPEDSKYLNNQSLLISEITGGRRFEHLRFSSTLECKNSRSVTSGTYKIKTRINSNGSGSYDNNGQIYLGLWNLNDGNNPMVVEYVELTATNISNNFTEYSFPVPGTSLPINLGELNKKYEIVVMYDSNGAVSGKTLNVDIDEASRELAYDDTSANCVPTITPPSSTTIPSATASGSTVVLGSSLGTTDLDEDKLTYSITAGNTGNYFAIDSSTGNITTTSSNIPAGTYKLSVQVDDGKGGKTTAEVVIVVAASESGKGSGSDSTGTPSSTSSLVKAPKTGAVLMSLMLVPILIGGLAYLYVAQHNKISIKKKSER